MFNFKMCSCEKEWAGLQRRIMERDAPLLHSMNVAMCSATTNFAAIRAGVSVILDSLTCWRAREKQFSGEGKPEGKPTEEG